MWSFLAEFTRRLPDPYTILVMDEGGMEQPRQYHVHPQHVVAFWAGSVLLAMLLTAGLLAFTPLRDVVLGTGTTEMKRSARLNTLRLTALQDSLATQHRYVANLRDLLTGKVDTSQSADPPSAPSDYEAPPPSTNPQPEPHSQNWTDHQQPALSVERAPATTASAPLDTLSKDREALSSLQPPVLPPVEGFLTRGYNARTGHYAIDIAVDEGTVVRSIGDGYVIMADWTNDGGYMIAVQHANGFVSVYKHNKRLLKRIGDRVHAREAVAMSGNTGEVTTGPHLHFELWRHGLAQDPRYYFIGM